MATITSACQITLQSSSGHCLGLTWFCMLILTFVKWKMLSHTLRPSIACATRQLTIADFSLGVQLAAPAGESLWRIGYFADSKPVSAFGPLCENMTFIFKNWSTQDIALSSEVVQAMAAHNLSNLWAVWSCGFWDVQADKLTAPHTDVDCSTLHHSWR